MPQLDRSSTVAQIVTAHPAAARVFQKHGIDYCCRGNVTVPVASRARHLDPEALFAELAVVLAADGREPEGDPRELATPALLARIVDEHHGYLRRALPRIAPISSKVAIVHGGKDARLGEVDAVFRALSAALLPHLDEEETVLFPALMVARPDERLVRRELARMFEDHVAVGEMLTQLRALTDGFTTPEWGCTTYRALMAELEALEGDILRHVHLENHVVAPRFSGALGAEERLPLS